MPVTVTCVHALCAVLPLLASPIEAPKESKNNIVQAQKNPTPWNDAFCRPVNYIIHDPSGTYQGLHVAMRIIEEDPDIKWEKKLFCYSAKENKEGYF